MAEDAAGPAAVMIVYTKEADGFSEEQIPRTYPVGDGKTAELFFRPSRANEKQKKGNGQIG